MEIQMKSRYHFISHLIIHCKDSFESLFMFYVYFNLIFIS